MANHVSWNIHFQEINDAAKAKWLELCGRMEKENYEYWMGDMWVYEDGPVSTDDVRQYSWTTENIGPKWCYIQEFDEDSCYGYSAWSWPEQGLNWILEQLSELDPNLITSVSFDDEMPNFFGTYTYDGADLYDGFEDDYEELQERIFQEHPHLREKWDSDEEEWKDDESEEEFREVMYEVMHNAQDDDIQENIKYIKEGREEEPVGC